MYGKGAVSGPYFFLAHEQEVAAIVAGIAAVEVYKEELLQDTAHPPPRNG